MSHSGKRSDFGVDHRKQRRGGRGAERAGTQTGFVGSLIASLTTTPRFHRDGRCFWLRSTDPAGGAWRRGNLRHLINSPTTRTSRHGGVLSSDDFSLLFCEGFTVKKTALHIPNPRSTASSDKIEAD